MIHDTPPMQFSTIPGFAVIVFYAGSRNGKLIAISAEITVYLKPGDTGKGIGTQAVRHIEAIAKTRAIHSLIAVICGENTQSIRLFEQNGYHQCARYREIGQKFGRMLDVCCYQKILRME